MAYRAMRFGSKAASLKALGMKYYKPVPQLRICMCRAPWPHAVGLHRRRSVCSVAATRTQDAPPRGPPAKFEQLDFTQIAALNSELQQWLPSKVQRVQMADPHTLALYIRAIDRQGWLHLSWHPRTARVCLGNEPDQGDASSSYPFAQLVRTKCAAATNLTPSESGSVNMGIKHARVAWCRSTGTIMPMLYRLLDQLLIGCSMPVPFDRVLKLEFAPQLDSGAHMSLLCEIQGAYSNMVLVDGDNNTLLAARQIGSQQTSVRAIRVGAPYVPPPAPPGTMPSPGEPIDQWQAHILSSCPAEGPQHGVALAMMRGYQGVSLALAHDLCFRASVPPDEAVSDLGADAWAALHGEWQGWLSACESGSFNVTKDDHGRLSVLGSFEQQCSSVHEAVNEQFFVTQAAERFMQLRAALTRALSAAVHKLKGKLSAFEKQLESADDAEVTQKRADLVMANVYRWPKGALEMQVEDWETGEKVSLKITDATMTPVEHAEKLYKRAAKQRRAAEKLFPLIEEAEKLLDYVEEVQESVALLERMDGVQDLRALQEIQDELVEQGLMKAPTDAKLAAKSKAKAEKAAKKRRNVSPGGAGSPYRLFTSPAGLQILIGRNNRQNDELSTRVANDGDVWMHARGVPGSHLVIRVPAGSAPDDEDIQYAANLSVYFSKARESGKWDVTMTDAKHIKKPRGAKPGQVLVGEERVVTGFPGRSAAVE